MTVARTLISVHRVKDPDLAHDLDRYPRAAWAGRIRHLARIGLRVEKQTAPGLPGIKGGAHAPAPPYAGALDDDDILDEILDENLLAG